MLDEEAVVAVVVYYRYLWLLLLFFCYELVLLSLSFQVVIGDPDCMLSNTSNLLQFTLSGSVL